MTATNRIAVIEDEAPIRRGVADVLRASGYEVAEAADGARGLEEANRPGITLVLLDLVEAVLRRSPGRPADDIRARLGRAVIDFARREVRWSERERGELSETEAAILCYLVSNRKRAVSREELLQHVWGIDTAGLETRTVDMHIARLRVKLRDPSGRKSPEAVLTVRAHGYMAAPDLVPLAEPAVAS
jgi:two-component system, OmpR family, response regulator RpaB